MLAISNAKFLSVDFKNYHEQLCKQSGHSALHNEPKIDFSLFKTSSASKGLCMSQSFFR